MAIKFPCEMIGWIVLPSIRRELTVYLIKEKKIPRKKVGETLDLTPAALSQYIKENCSRLSFNTVCNCNKAYISKPMDANSIFIFITNYLPVSTSMY